METKIYGEQLFEKFKLLSFFEKKEISDFLDFLLNRKQQNITNKKKILMNTSVWDAKDEKAINNVKRELNKSFKNP